MRGDPIMWRPGTGLASYGRAARTEPRTELTVLIGKADVAVVGQLPAYPPLCPGSRAKAAHRAPAAPLPLDGVRVA